MLNGQWDAFLLVHIFEGRKKVVNLLAVGKLAVFDLANRFARSKQLLRWDDDNNNIRKLNLLITRFIKLGWNSNK